MSVNCNMNETAVHLHMAEGNCPVFWYNSTAVCPWQGMLGCFVNNTCKSSPFGAVNVLVLEKLMHSRDRALAQGSRDWQYVGMRTQEL